MTLSSLLSSMGSAMTGMCRVLISGSGTGGTGGWSSDVLTVGFKCGDWRGGGCCANPGVLLQDTQLCVPGACLITLGAVGLLESIGSTLGAWASGVSTLGCCLLVCLKMSLIIITAC